MEALNCSLVVRQVFVVVYAQLILVRDVKNNVEK
jgi:hypothetical protein